MRILHVMPDIEKEASGPSYSVMRLCESLRALGDNAELALLAETSVSSKPYIRPFKRGFGPWRLGASPEMRRWLADEVATGKADVVHNHSLWMMPNIYPGWATRGTPAPYVVSPRGTLSAWAMASGSKFKNLFWPLLQKPAIQSAALFHATAISEFEDIRRLGFQQPVAVIPNGIDLPDHFVKPDRQRRTLLFLGRLHPVKGIEFLLQAWAALQNEFPEWHLRIVGPGEAAYVSALRSRAKGLARVQFDGPLFGQDKLDAYRSADLYVLPTYSENFGMTVAEALACGTPVVASRGAPWHKLKTEGAGWWPEIGTEPLLNCLREAMNESQMELDARGEKGRLWMSKEFCWGSIASSMHDVYSWLLGKGDMPTCVIKD